LQDGTIKKTGKMENFFSNHAINLVAINTSRKPAFQQKKKKNPSKDHLFFCQAFLTKGKKQKRRDSFIVYTHKDDD